MDMMSAFFSDWHIWNMDNNGKFIVGFRQAEVWKNQKNLPMSCLLHTEATVKTW